MGKTPLPHQTLLLDRHMAIMESEGLLWAGSAQASLAGAVLSHPEMLGPCCGGQVDGIFLVDSGYSRAKHDPDDTRRKSRLEPRKS